MTKEFDYFAVEFEAVPGPPNQQWIVGFTTEDSKYHRYKIGKGSLDEGIREVIDAITESKNLTHHLIYSSIIPRADILKLLAHESQRMQVISVLSDMAATEIMKQIIRNPNERDTNRGVSIEGTGSAPQAIKTIWLLPAYYEEFAEGAEEKCES